MNGGESPGAVTGSEGQTQIQTPVSSRTPGSLKSNLCLLSPILRLTQI